MKKIIFICILFLSLSTSLFCQNYLIDDKFKQDAQIKIPYSEIKTTKLVQGITLIVASAGFATVQYITDKKQYVGYGDIKPYVFSGIIGAIGVGILISIPGKEKYQLKK